jgi:rhamnulokinase
LECASTLLMMGDLLGYFLTGTKVCERSNATTAQLYDPRTGRWDEEIFRILDLPSSIMPEPVNPGTPLGDLRQSVGREVGLKRAPVIAPCTHDTGCAVAAVPATGDDWAFLSSGTWSVLGAVTEEVVTSPDAFSAVAFNEMTLERFYLCRNIMGLWLLQQARAAWQRGGRDYSYEELVQMAGASAENGPLLNPDDPSFLAPRDMLWAIGAYCQKTGQRQPEGPGATTRCILKSLALSYRHGLERLERILGRKFSVLHIVGGGSRNSLLCQLAADATGIPVLAGPVEATVAGNVLVQALATGWVSSAAEVREVSRRSTDLLEYQPQNTSGWEDRYAEYLRLLELTAA